MKPIYMSKSTELFITQKSDLKLPYVGGVVAGFPSPADDFAFESSNQ